MQDGAPTPTRDLLKRWRLEVLRLLQQRRQLSAALATTQEAVAAAQAEHVRVRNLAHTQGLQLRCTCAESSKSDEFALLTAGAARGRRTCQRLG
jgi:hypothetical protein